MTGFELLISDKEITTLTSVQLPSNLIPYYFVSYGKITFCSTGRCNWWSNRINVHFLETEVQQVSFIEIGLSTKMLQSLCLIAWVLLKIVKPKLTWNETLTFVSWFRLLLIFIGISNPFSPTSLGSNPNHTVYAFLYFYLSLMY